MSEQSSGRIVGVYIHPVVWNEHSVYADGNKPDGQAAQSTLKEFLCMHDTPDKHVDVIPLSTKDTAVLVFIARQRLI